MHHRIDLISILAKRELGDFRLKGFEPVGGLGQMNVFALDLRRLRDGRDRAASR
jgi:hypothetical protein